jgi:hypothetical protein
MNEFHFAEVLLSSSPFVEEASKEALTNILQRIKWKGFLDVSPSTASFSFIGNSFTFDIVLRANKGSLTTYLWNIFGRIDDEYVAYLRVSGQDNDPEQLIWHVSGLDYVNKRVHECTVHWPLLQCLREECGIDNIGVQCFGKLLIHSLLNIPSYFHYNRMENPMPATFMHNCMLVVSSCPVSISLPSLLIDSSVESLIAVFRDDIYGHALWLRNVDLYWTTANQKVLCSTQRASSSVQLMKMFSPDTLRDIGIRIVEIFPTVLNSVGYAVVLEVINRKKWVHNVRFVITDISTLRRILLDANSSHSQSRDGNTTSQNELRASTRAESLNNLKADHAFLKRTSELPSLCLRIYDETVSGIAVDFSVSLLIIRVLMSNRNGLLLVSNGTKFNYPKMHQKILPYLIFLLIFAILVAGEQQVCSNS